MKTLLLRLEGPMQSWGLASRFRDRDSAFEPTKSGVVGLCCAALGTPRDDDATVQQVAALRMAVRVDRPGVLLRDFQTAGGGRFAGEDYGVYKASGGKGDTALSWRSYLSEASFLVGLGGDDDGLLARLEAALRNPHWPLALGRRAYAPSVPVCVGVVEGAPVEALTAAARHPGAGPDAVRLVVEDPQGLSTRRDQPLSFRSDDRRFALRTVREALLPPLTKETT